MKKIIIMGCVTVVLSMLIVFLPINSKYLGVFEDTMSLEYVADTDTYWELSTTNDNIVISDSSIKEKTYYWNFIPQKNGNTTVTMYNKNKSDDSIITTIKYDFKIEENKIVWINGEATGLTDFPNPY